MDAMDEFQEADILWPDAEDELLAPFAPMDTEELYECDAAGSVSSVALAPVFGRRFVEEFFLSGGAGPSSSSVSHEDEEWQEADVLWPDTADDHLRGSGGGSMWPFSGCSGGGRRAGRRVKPAAARRDGWATGTAASSPINIPANVAPRCRFTTAMNRRS